MGTCFDQLDDDGDGLIDDGCPGLVTPFTVGTPEPKRGVALDGLLDLQAQVSDRCRDLRL